MLTPVRCSTVVRTVGVAAKPTARTPQAASVCHSISSADTCINTHCYASQHCCNGVATDRGGLGAVRRSGGCTGGEEASIGVEHGVAALGGRGQGDVTVG